MLMQTGVYESNAKKNHFMVNAKQECGYDKACLRAPLRFSDEERMMEVMLTEQSLWS